jgi:hypothetical protein
MPSRLKFWLITSIVFCGCGLLFGTYRSAATGQTPARITLQATGSVLETYEPIRAISAADDDGTIQVVSGWTGNVETYRSEKDGSLRLIDRAGAAASKTQSGLTLEVGAAQISMFDLTGTMTVRFKTYPIIAHALLSTGDIVIASPTKSGLLHIYSPDGRLVRSFGARMERIKTDEAETQFLQRGKLLVDAEDNIYYVFGFMPVIQKFSPDGRLLYEVEVQGEAVDLQQALARRFFRNKKPDQVGGIDIIRGAALARQTGHLWLALNGSSTSGVVYEYSGDGRKVREYALESNVPGLSRYRLTGVKGIAVTAATLYVLTNEQQIYRFNLTDSLQARSWPSQPARPLRRGTLATPFASAGRLQPPVQTGCGTSQTWNGCSFTCPMPGACTGNPPVPPNDTSNGSTQDCKTALRNSLTESYSVVSSSCSQFVIGTKDHTRGGCQGSVTICKNGDITTHNVTLDCPAQSCQIAGQDPCYMTGSCEWGGNPGDGSGIPGPGSPILIDITGNGFSLTDAANGVAFDLNADGVKQGMLAWTLSETDDAWLALDRNGNGTIDNGQELFGNFTPQPPTPTANGFLALAAYDKPASGGNNDGVLDRRDAVFASLRLWQDTNHNGLSEPGELHTLSALGLTMLDLDYKESRRTDQYGNQFRYRAKVADARQARAGRWAWDVFLVAAP